MRVPSGDHSAPPITFLEERGSVRVLAPEPSTLTTTTRLGPENRPEAEPYRISDPSGDHARLLYQKQRASSSLSSDHSTRSLPPSGSIAYSPCVSSPSLMNAIRVPSGDHAGLLAASPSSVRPDPSGRTVWTIYRLSYPLSVFSDW